MAIDMFTKYLGWWHWELSAHRRQEVEFIHLLESWVRQFTWLSGYSRRSMMVALVELIWKVTSIDLLTSALVEWQSGNRTNLINFPVRLNPDANKVKYSNIHRHLLRNAVSCDWNQKAWLVGSVTVGDRHYLPGTYPRLRIPTVRLVLFTSRQA